MANINNLYNYIDSVTDNKKIFSNIYCLKRNLLMVENIHGESFMFADKDTISHFKKKFADITTLNQLNILIQNFVYLLKEHCVDEVGDTQFGDWEWGDHEQFTDKYHHRKFWNEIENPEIIDELIHTFCKLWNNENHKIYTDSNYDKSICTWNVRLYYFNDFDLYFENPEETYAFVEDFSLDTPIFCREPNESEWKEVYNF